MLCQTCQTIYPFYLKFCRTCGNKLNQQERPAMVKTSELASTSRSAEVGESAKQYCTAPLTMEIGGKKFTISDVVKQILDSFPSLDTVKMNNSPINPSAGLLARSMRETLREFDLEELKNMERTSELMLAVQQQVAGRNKRPDTTTLELPVNRAAQRVADTAPIEPNKVNALIKTIDNATITTASTMSNDVEKLNSRELSSSELKRNCTPVRLHLRPTSRELNLPATEQFIRPNLNNRENLYEHLKTVTRRVMDLICSRVLKTLVNA